MLKCFSLYIDSLAVGINRPSLNFCKDTECPTAPIRLTR